jgi:drug/metabolite transporter (DMT)-like permease
METVLGLVVAVVGVAIVVTPWAVARPPDGRVTTVLEALGAAVSLLGLALSHRLLPLRRPRRPRR